MSDKFKDIVIRKLGVDPFVFSKGEALAKTESILLVHALIRLGAADPKHLLAAYAHVNKIRVADLDEMDIPKEIIHLIKADVARKSRIIPLDRVGNNLIIASENPHDLKLHDLLRFQTGFSVKAVLSSEDQIRRAIQRYYQGSDVDLNKLTKQKASTVKSKTKIEKRAVIGEHHSEEDGPIIQLVDQILLQCVSRGASDIHIEPYEGFLRVRLRVDGALHEIARPPANFKAPVISRFKIMAGLNIAEKRLPQDGNINVDIMGKPIDFRVNTLPTLHGEKVVLRILDKSALQVDLTRLGFERADLERFKDAIYRPFGMVLVTGPTGSGKTTTLYSAITDLNEISENIITAEDPVEYNLEGINQVQINAEIGLSFASALRAFLRQDPDIIMVGEIRDLETGEIAIKAALTGHLVLSTLHTNSAADTIVRMQNMGLESFNIIAALNCVVAQRLMRKLCQHCKVTDNESRPEYIVQLGANANDVQKYQIFKAKGCERCSHTGYRGRIAVHEVMLLNDELRTAIMNNANSMELKAIGIKNGMLTLRQNALKKVFRGETDILEVIKVTSSDRDSNATSDVA